MIVLNYGHPLTKEQLAKTEELAGRFHTRLIEVSFKIVEEQPLEPQIAILVERAGLSSTEWQTAPLIINLPSYALAAACLIAVIEEYMGRLPTIIKLRRKNDSVVYEVSELINLDEMRNIVRTRQ